MTNNILIDFSLDELDNLKFADIFQKTLVDYFATINAAQFQSTAELFAEDGILYPPFDSALIGRNAIATYLAREATGMKLIPEQGSVFSPETENFAYRVNGKVQTPLFSVNVAWEFVLNADSEILAVKIKLLAKLEELIKFS